ncbi:MAG: GNAT family N-acetyltransferase [Longimicrobiales bacterium]
MTRLSSGPQTFLFRFGYESPEEWLSNQRDGTDFESSAAAWVAAADAAQAEDLGRGYAHRFVAGVFHDAGVAFPGWLDSDYAHWLEPESDIEATPSELEDIPRIRMPEPISVQTERLVRRELRDSDFEAVHAYATDSVVVKFMPWGPNSDADTVAFLMRAANQAVVDPRREYELAITRGDTGELLGAIGLHQVDPGEPTAMLGYCLARPAWGHGYATEAGRAMMRFGFLDLGVESVWAGCDAENAASISVLEKLGMVAQPQEQQRNVGLSEGGSVMYRLRASEWTGRGSTT